MAELVENINKVETLDCAGKLSPLKVDFVVLRFELDDSTSNVLSCARDLLFNSEMQEESEGATASPEAVAQALGRRAIRDIQIETYTPNANSDDTTPKSYAEATGPAHPLGSPSLLRERAGSRGEPSALVSRDKISFFSGIPAVERIKGVLHLYRHRVKGTPDHSHVSKLVCLLCIPASQQLSDILEFLAPVKSVIDSSTIQSLRVIRDSTPNQYMLLLQFKDEALAEKFYTTYNGRPYNSLEVAVCQLVYVSRVEVMKSSQGGGMPVSGLTELPSCPVCLERLDDSVLTILCNHSFHTYCLTQWEDSTCPVCRYTQTPEVAGDNMCSCCDSKEDLWICLICGNIGCGRYLGGHSHNHFIETQHTFSMQLGTQRVWDYIGDNYVHRLVQNKTDGKLVEVSGRQGMIADDEKVDSLQLEYTYLLTSQLESQRLFFEEKLARVEKDATDQIAAVEVRCRAAVSDREHLEETGLELDKDKRAADKRIQQLQAKVAKLTADLKEEKELNKCMSDNQKLWRDRVTILENKLDVTIQQKERELQDLQEQVRDLMFYLETQKKISESPETTRQEIQEGHLVVTQSHGATGTPARRGRKKKS